MRVLFDANVLFAAFTAKGLCEELVAEATHLVRLIWSPILKKELIGVLQKKRLISQTVLATVDLFAELCAMHAPAELSGPVCRDRDDDIVLGVAVAGKAEAIVTGDADLLVLKRYTKIRIYSPRQFLELLHAQR